jgi:hypothetical protein
MISGGHVQASLFDLCYLFFIPSTSSRDPRRFLLAFMQNMHFGACGFNNFFSTVIGSLGFDSIMTSVLICSPCVLFGIPT